MIRIDYTPIVNYFSSDNASSRNQSQGAYADEYYQNQNPTNHLLACHCQTKRAPCRIGGRRQACHGIRPSREGSCHAPGLCDGFCDLFSMVCRPRQTAPASLACPRCSVSCL